MKTRISLSTLPLLGLLLATGSARAQVGTFTNATSTTVPNGIINNGGQLAAQWGDYDADGHLDLLLGGVGDGQNLPPVLQGIWHNNGNGMFSDVTSNAAPGLPMVWSSTAAWGDYDNDGRLDFLFTGERQAGSAISELWRNNGDGTFYNVTTTAAAGLPGVEQGEVAWSDYDNDGHPDFLLGGIRFDNSGPYAAILQLWHNNGNGTFDNVTATAAPGLPGLYVGSVAWGDYDKDGYLDLLLTGWTNSVYSYTGISEIWHNNGNGTFSNVTATAAAGLPPVGYGSAVWGDYDGDGYLDMALTGVINNGGQVTQIWHNNGNGTFSNVTATAAPGLPPLGASSVACGDYDNDGRLDLLIAGSETNGTFIAEIWHNNGDSTFSNVTATVAPGLSASVAGLGGGEATSVGWGDYDGSGRLDFMIASDGVAIWHNDLSGVNSPPSVPTGLQATVTGGVVTLNWNASTDDHTPTADLTYNLRIGTTPGGSQVMAPMSLAGGPLTMPARGNVQFNLSRTLRLQLGGSYYWSMQAVDNGYAASALAPEQQFTLGATLTKAGDVNGDGVVEQSELDTVISNYWQTSPPNVESVISPSNTDFQFGLMNLDSLNFQVLASTNLALPLTDWTNIGTATLNYQFGDPDATNYPQRFYQLVWP